MRGLSLFSSKRTRVLGVSALLCLLALQLMHVARATSASWDEAHHLFDGYTVWKQHSYTLNPEVPPLVKLAAAAPLLPMRLTIPENQGRPTQTESFLDGKAFVFGNGGDQVLFPARLACMVFAVLLGLLIYLAASEMFGFVAGLVALAFFVFDPNFLAHGALVTTDVGSSCFFVASVYAFYRYCKRPTWGRMLIIAIASGLMLATKFSGVFLPLMFVLMVLIEWLLARSARVLGQRLLAVAAIGVVAWVILWSFYGFRYQAGVGAHQLNPSLSTYLSTMHDQKDAKRLAFLAKYHVLPEAYLWGLENTKETEFLDTCYFWGHVSVHGTRLYFPAAFLIKSTLPFLIVLCLFPLAWTWGLGGRIREVGFILIPAAVYFAIAMHSDMDIGVRHILPVYAFLYILLGATAMTLGERSSRWTWGLGILLCWQIVTSYRAAPAYMAYGNEAWGGPSQVHRYLSDANTDWGQQLKGVKRYLDARHITNCWFAYFPDGAIEPSDYGVHCKRLPTVDGLWWLDLPMSVPPLIDGTVLISDSDLAGIEFGDGALNPYDSFRNLKPDAAIEEGIYAYTGSFAIPLAAALVAVHDSQKLLWADNVQGALQKADAALQLAPASAKVQEAFADALAASGKRGEALAHYQLALHSAQGVRPDLQADLIIELRGKITRLEAAGAS